MKGHVGRLYDYGLRPTPTWGQGKNLPGVSLYELSDAPPSLKEALATDYSGGLSIICGTAHPLGGFVTGVDVDAGPSAWPQAPFGFLYAEQGSTDEKAHLFVRTLNGTDGPVNIRGRDGRLVAEVKSKGQALRSYPTHPEGKPRPYQPLAWSLCPQDDPPQLTVHQLAYGLADFLGHALREVVQVEHCERHTGAPAIVSSWLVQQAESALDRRGVRLCSPVASGWQSGQCPFHQDRMPSFSVNFEIGAWKCWAGCGSGYLQSLARRLGVISAYTRNGHVRLPALEVMV